MFDPYGQFKDIEARVQVQRTRELAKKFKPGTVKFEKEVKELDSLVKNPPKPSEIAAARRHLVVNPSPAMIGRMKKGVRSGLNGRSYRPLAASMAGKERTARAARLKGPTQAKSTIAKSAARRKRR